MVYFIHFNKINFIVSQKMYNIWEKHSVLSETCDFTKLTVAFKIICTIGYSFELITKVVNAIQVV